jgi:hypothetical protein
VLDMAPCSSDNTKRMRYRVHNSLLARNSTYFADMESNLPPRTDEKLTRYSCGRVPFIELTGNHFKHTTGNIYWLPFKIRLISFLLRPARCSFHLRLFNANKHPIGTVVAMLNIMKKYQFQSFLAEARSRLRQCFPTSLEQLKKRNTCRTVTLNNVSDLLQGGCR